MPVNDDRLVDAKDTLSLGGRWDGACGISSEESIAVAGDKAVAKLAKEAGDDAEDRAEEGEGVVDETEGLVYGVGTAVEALMWSEGGGEEDDAFRGWIGGVLEWEDKFFRQRGLLGDEAKLAGGVVFEKVANDAVAEGADAVVEDDGVAFDLGVLKIGHGACCDSYNGVDA